MPAETADILHHSNVMQNLFQRPREICGAGEGILALYLSGDSCIYCSSIYQLRVHKNMSSDMFWMIILVDLWCTKHHCESTIVNFYLQKANLVEEFLMFKICL